MSATLTSHAVLSVRLPSPARDRLKAAAAVRGETVQGLVGTLVERFLAEEGRRPPELAAVLGTLRRGAAGLRQRGVCGLWVLGSVVRGEPEPAGVVHLMAEFEVGTRVSLVRLASLRADLSDLLGGPADLTVRGAVHAGIAGGLIEHEAVRVL